MRSVVSADRAFEMEFLYSREEIRIRMEYNRRLLTGQVTLIAALIAGGLSLLNQNSATPVLLQIAAAGVIWLNAAFVCENMSNDSHISAAAIFMHNVLNSKYRLAGTERMIHEWELFLTTERQLSDNFIKRHSYIVDATFLLNLFLTGMAICSYYIAVRQPSFHLSRLAMVSFTVGLVCTACAYWGYFHANTSWKTLIAPGQAKEFKRSVVSSLQQVRAADAVLPTTNDSNARPR